MEKEIVIGVTPVEAAALCLEFNETLPGITDDDRLKGVQDENFPAIFTWIGMEAYSFALFNGGVSLEDVVEATKGIHIPEGKPYRFQVI